MSLRSQSFQEKEKKKEHKIQIQSSLVLKNKYEQLLCVSCISGFCSFLGEKCKRLGRWHMETCFWSHGPSDQLGGNQRALEPLTDSLDHIHQASTLCVKIVAKQKEYSNQQWRELPPTRRRT